MKKTLILGGLLILLLATSCGGDDTAGQDIPEDIPIMSGAEFSITHNGKSVEPEDAPGSESV